LNLQKGLLLVNTVGGAATFGTQDAVVSILSRDHYYSSESAFSAALESALEIASNILRKALFWKGMP